MKPNKKELMSSYQLPGDMAGKVIFLNPKKSMPGYEYGGYQSFMQQSIELKLLCRDLHIDHDEAIRRLNEYAVVAPPSEPVKPKKSPVKRFEKPSEFDITNYMMSKGMTINPASAEAEKFFNYYESNGWKVGKNPMKSWEAAARNWMKNNHGGNSSAVDQSGFVSGGQSAIESEVIPSQAGFLTHGQ